MKLTFLDIGAHTGQTLEEVLKPKYEFKRVVSFEPMPREFEILNSKYGQIPHLELHNYGLLDKSGIFPMYGTNERHEASVYITKVDCDTSVITQCKFIRASVWFQNCLSEEEVTIVKLNCEGSEIPILNDLIDTGEIWKIEFVMIDFDVRKVRGMEDEKGKLLDRFSSIGFNRYISRFRVRKGNTPQEFTANWLTKALR